MCRSMVKYFSRVLVMFVYFYIECIQKRFMLKHALVGKTGLICSYSSSSSSSLYLMVSSIEFFTFASVLTPADECHHVDKHKFNVPFVCGAKDLGEALRRISEGAAMIRTKGEAGTG